MLSISGELIVSRYVAESITTDVRMFHPRRPLSTACKTVLYTGDKGRNILQSVVIDSATYLLSLFARHTYTTYNTTIQYNTHTHTHI